MRYLGFICFALFLGSYSTASAAHDDVKELIERIISKEAFVKNAPWVLLDFEEKPEEEIFKKRFKKYAFVVFPDQVRLIYPELYEISNTATRLLVEAKHAFLNSDFKFSKSYNGEFKTPKNFMSWHYRFEGRDKLFVTAEDENGFHEVIFQKGEYTQVRFQPTKMEKVLFEESHTYQFLKSRVEEMNVFLTFYGEEKLKNSMESFNRAKLRLEYYQGKYIYDVLAPEYQQSYFNSLYAAFYAAALFDDYFETTPKKKEKVIPLLTAKAMSGEDKARVFQDDSGVTMKNYSIDDEISDSVKEFQERKKLLSDTKLRIGNCNDEF